MPCRLFWHISYWTQKFQCHLNQNRIIFIQENAFESVICKMATSLCRPQCVIWIDIDLIFSPVYVSHEINSQKRRGSHVDYFIVLAALEVVNKTTQENWVISKQCPIYAHTWLILTSTWFLKNKHFISFATIHEIVIFWSSSKIRFMLQTYIHTYIYIYILAVSWWHHGATKIWVNIVSGNGPLPDGTKVTWNIVDSSLVMFYGIIYWAIHDEFPS